MLIDLTELKNYETKFSTIDKLWLEDEKAAKDKLGEEKHVTEAMRHHYMVRNGKTCKYLKARIIPSQKKGFFVIENGELVLKKSDFDKYEEKIKAKSKILYKAIVSDIDDLYHVDVFPEMESTVIDTEERKINICRPFNFKYNQIKVSKKTQDKYDKVMDFLQNVICKGDDEQWKCFSYVLGCITQYKKSQVILFLPGLQGTGKTKTMELIRKIVGDGAADCDEGHFTGDIQFNKHMSGAAVCFIEELEGADYGAKKKLMKGLKKLSTAELFVTREMHMDSYKVKNIMNIIIASNYINDIDVGDRRIFAIESDPKYQMNTEYFKNLDECMTEEVLQLIYNQFYRVDTSKVLLPPDNTNKTDTRKSRAKPAIKFLIEKYLVESPTKTQMKLNMLYTEFQSWAKETKTFVTDYATWSFDVRQYLSPVINENGAQRKSGGSLVYDLSQEDLKATIITRSKIITQEDLDDMIEANGEKPDYEDVFNSECKIEKLEADNKQLLARIAELEKLLEAKKEEVKEEEAPKKRKTAKITKSKDWEKCAELI
jgi:hypothetical protein